MKIGIDARLAFETGVGRYIRNILFNLSEIDKKNEYVVFLQSKDKDKIKLGNNFTKITANQRWHGIGEQVGFLNTIKKQNLDLMHFTYFSHPVLYKRPFVITLHDLIIFHHKTGTASTKNPVTYEIKHAGYKFAVKNAVKNSTRIIVPSHSVKRDIMKTFKTREEKITVTYEGIEKLPKAKKLEVPKNFFLYVGNAYPHKNLQFLIDSFVEFRINHEDTHLLLVGPNDTFYKGLNLDSNVRVLHDLSDAELAYLYENAKALIQPSLSEGFGLTPLEAMSQDCLVISSDIDTFREVLENNAVYFDPTNMNSLIQSLTHVYNLKQADKEKLTSHAKKYIKKFNWNTTAQQTLKVYQDSLDI